MALNFLLCVFYFVKEIHVYHGKSWKIKSKMARHSLMTLLTILHRTFWFINLFPLSWLWWWGFPTLRPVSVEARQGLHGKDPRCHLSHLQGAGLWG